MWNNVVGIAVEKLFCCPCSSWGTVLQPEGAEMPNIYTISSDDEPLQIDDARQSSDDDALVVPAALTTHLGNKRTSAVPLQVKKKRKSL
jgi:hypothetical protein